MQPTDENYLEIVALLLQCLKHIRNNASNSLLQKVQGKYFQNEIAFPKPNVSYDIKMNFVEL